MLTILALVIALHWDFEGGSLAKVDQISETRFRCHVRGETDQDGRNRQASWYYFRVDGAAGRPLVLEMADIAGEYNYRPSNGAIGKDTPPWFSYDGETWQSISTTEWDKDSRSLHIRFTPERDRVWLAHVPPYTTAHLARLMESLARHPHLRREVVGKTAGGRDMPLLTITNSAVPLAKKRVIWLMARQHAWETCTSWVCEGALRFLLSSDARAARIRDETVYRVFPMADPDGVARGGVRFNVHGYDLNRNWDAVDPRTMPEIAAQRKAILDWVDGGRRIDLVLSLHNNSAPTDHLQGALEAAGPSFTAAAERLSTMLGLETGFNPLPPRDLGTSSTPGKPGRMTIYQGLLQDRKIPALLMEQGVARSSRHGRALGIQDRMDFGAGLVRVLWAWAKGAK